MNVTRSAALLRVGNVTSIYDLPWLMLLGLMLFVPTTYKTLKVFLIAICLIQCLLTLVTDKKPQLKIHPTILIWLAIMLANGLFFVIRGGFNDAPGAMRVLTVVALWPILFVFLSQQLVRTTVLKKSIKWCVYSTIAICLYSVYFLLYEARILSSSMYFAIDMGQESTIKSTWIEFTINSLASLLFLVPCLLAGVFVWKGYFSKAIRLISWFGLLLGSVIVLISGRRALQLVTALAPFIFLFFWFMLPKCERQKNSKTLIRISIFSGCFGLIFALLFVSFKFTFVEALALRFSEGFQFNADVSATARMRQFIDLSTGWMEAPFFGHGWGSVAKGLVRDAQMPWAYELFYSAALFQLGLFGFLIYAAGIGWIYFMGSQMVRGGGIYSAIMLPLLTGMTCFLIANGTNPYLGKFDCMWVIFLPVACINSWLLQNRNHNPETDSVKMKSPEPLCSPL